MDVVVDLREPVQLCIAGHIGLALNGKIPYFMACWMALFALHLLRTWKEGRDDPCIKHDS